jgi:hypothetical protein
LLRAKRTLLRSLNAAFIAFVRSAMRFFSRRMDATRRVRPARPEAARRRLEAYHANQIKLRHERKEREAKEAREELAHQMAEPSRTAGWGNTAGRRVVRAICQVGPVREAGNDRIYIWRPCLSNRSVGIHAVF